ncbi:phosphatase domain-containing protein [Paenibacillus sp. UNC451MF]|uniref:phosphatase domain-containing protein n=1 Tax=Paenibacillus sp. UNC451MF TaxID=1449063 RepID=UPI00068A93F9|nr:hypothetical protein [Paenibacillus sp. UNC451MF]
MSNTEGTDLIRLVVERENIDRLPKRFRMPSMVSIPAEADLDLTGFGELRASASGQYSHQELQNLKRSVGPVPITLVDLRQESHGFVNGMAVNWLGSHNGANKGLTNEEVQAVNDRLLNNLIREKSIRFDYVEGKSVFIEHPLEETVQVLSEEALAQLEGVQYKRFFVTDHHRPSDAEVDRFIAWVKELPDPMWLHFHCRGGVGRASTFFCMYDMMNNAANVSLDHILQRNTAIGGRDFNRMDPKDTYKYEAAQERLAFIGRFYTYCIHNNHNQYELSWTRWKEEQGS